jgi:hypothetical protein
MRLIKLLLTTLFTIGVLTSCDGGNNAQQPRVNFPYNTVYTFSNEVTPNNSLIINSYRELSVPTYVLSPTQIISKGTESWRTESINIESNYITQLQAILAESLFYQVSSANKLSVYDLQGTDYSSAYSAITLASDMQYVAPLGGESFVGFDDLGNIYKCDAQCESLSTKIATISGGVSPIAIQIINNAVYAGFSNNVIAKIFESGAQPTFESFILTLPPSLELRNFTPDIIESAELESFYVYARQIGTSNSSIWKCDVSESSNIVPCVNRYNNIIPGSFEAFLPYFFAVDNTSIYLIHSITTFGDVPNAVVYSIAQLAK